MNGNELLDCMELAAPAFLEDADTARAVKKTYRWVPFAAAAAACAAIALFAGLTLGGKTAPVASGPAQPDQSLPLLTVSPFTGTMGFEGYLAYSPDELTNGCPWDETMTLDTLPVYQNLHPVDEMGEADVPQRRMVQYSPPVELPAGLNFSVEDASCADLEAVADYLMAEYAADLDMTQPVVDIQGGDRTYLGKQHFSLHFYEGSGSVADRLVARDLSSQWWCGDDQGHLWIVWRNEYDLSEKLGDYPILTPREARDALCSGNYITTVPAEMPGEDYIVRVELLYRTEQDAACFMPYYRFLVEVPSLYYGQPQTEVQYGIAVDGQPVEGDAPQPTPRPADDGAGLKTYGAYYVPAVRPEYLAGMSTWDGSFNR